MPRRRSAVGAFLVLVATSHSALAQTPSPAPAAIAPADSAHPETIEQMLIVADMEHLYAQSMEASITAQMKANPQLAPYEDILRAFMLKYASYASMKPDFIRIYRATFSEADMQETIRFYQSPFGRRLMAKMPALMAQTGAMSAGRVQAHLPELIADIQSKAATAR
jgi:hypothetical protein